MIKEIAFVGYPTTNMKRSREFYEGVLGLKSSDAFGPLTDESQFAEYLIGDTAFSLGCMPEWKPSKDGPYIAFEMENFDEAIEKLKANNVTFTMEKVDTSACFMAMVQDPDGNSILIHKRHNS